MYDLDGSEDDDEDIWMGEVVMIGDGSWVFIISDFISRHIA